MIRTGLAVATALLLCFPSWAASTTQTNEQSVAPAGGVAVQKGITTAPSKCADGQMPDAKTGECHGTVTAVAPTSNTEDANASTDSVKQPAMK